MKDTRAPETPGYQLPFVAVSGLSEPYSQDGVLFRAALIRPKVCVRRLVVAACVFGQNDSANYWEISLCKKSGSIVIVNTSALLAGNWATLQSSTCVNYIDSSIDPLVWIEIRKHGFPGSISLAPSAYAI